MPPLAARVPAEVTLRETLAFLEPQLQGRRRVLEVGCGRGALAARLAASGWEVTALDVALHHLVPERPPGLTFVERDFLAYDGGPFDAVLFTSSLHHIYPLDRALDRAREALVPGGVLVAEEFALEAPDAATARWHFETQALLAAAGLYPEEHLHGQPSAEPRARWLAEHAHEHPLHEGAAMLDGLRRRFEHVEASRGPYLYRYLCHGLPADERGLRIAEHLLETERRRIDEGSLQAVGLRLVARAAPLGSAEHLR